MGDWSVLVAPSAGLTSYGVMRILDKLYPFFICCDRDWIPWSPFSGAVCSTCSREIPKLELGDSPLGKVSLALSETTSLTEIRSIVAEWLGISSRDVSVQIG